MGFWEPDRCSAQTPLGDVCFDAYRDHAGGARVWRGTPVTLADGILIGVTHDDLHIPWGPLSRGIVWPDLSFLEEVSGFFLPSTSGKFLVPNKPGSYRIRLRAAGPSTGGLPSRTSLAMMVGLGLL
jgi:hypothetical protein